MAAVAGSTVTGSPGPAESGSDLVAIDCEVGEPAVDDLHIGDVDAGALRQAHHDAVRCQVHVRRLDLTPEGGDRLGEGRLVEGVGLGGRSRGSLLLQGEHLAGIAGEHRVEVGEWVELDRRRRLVGGGIGLRRGRVRRGAGLGEDLELDDVAGRQRGAGDERTTRCRHRVTREGQIGVRVR